MPESLDDALFRSFDEIISYPIPTEEEIYKYYKRELSSLKSIPENYFSELSKKSIGLNFSDLEKICHDYLKNIIVYGKEKSNLDFLFETIESRKRPF